MKAVFADTSYYVALFSARDVRHDVAMRCSQKLRCRTIVTDYVLVELGSALSRQADRSLFVDLVGQLRADPNVEVVQASADLFDRGLSLFARRSDKSWSLIDCISFVVMEREGVSEALTTDHHFEQAGFTALLE